MNAKVEITTYTLSDTLVDGYDALGRLLAEADPLGQVTCYEYDALSNRTALSSLLTSSTIK